FLLATLGAFTVYAVLFVVDEWALIRGGVPPILSLVVRLIAIAFLIGYALYRRSLTTWILVSMSVVAEIGHALPQVGVGMRVLSLIFLRLIKTIIAPLLFATLVVGIAGHSSLRQVGRMGVKALVYFEVVTTLALFIGLAAINISKAGVGVAAPAQSESTDVKGQKQSASDVILHAFPENVAKAVADG